MKDITFWYTLVIMILVTICDLKVRSHRIAVSWIWYLFATSDAHVNLFQIFLTIRIGQIN